MDGLFTGAGCGTEICDTSMESPVTLLTTIIKKRNVRRHLIWEAELMQGLKITATFAACVLMYSLPVQAQEVIIKDNISGLSEAATNSLNNQTAGAGGGRQILLTQHVFTQRSQVTRFRVLSDSTAVPVANGFSYSVRSLNAPFTELFTGPVTRTSRTVYTDVTRAGNNTNLDEFAITGLTLDPGTYYFAVHASDGNAYQVVAHSASAGGVEPLLAESGGVPFLAGANFRLYTTLFAIVLQDTGIGRATTNFLTRRADQVTANLPPFRNRLLFRQSSGSSGSENVAFGRAMTGNRFAYSASFRELAHATRLANADPGPSSGAGPESQAAAFGTAVDDNGLGFWVEGGFSRREEGASANDFSQINAGIDLRLNPGLVVGAFAQFDNTDEDDGTSNVVLDGNGWMLGPYLVARIHENFVFDGMLAIGRSENDLTAGAVTGSFDAGRLYAKGQLTGDFRHGDWHFTPHVAVHYFEEDHEGFADSGGNAYAGETVSLGRLAFGPEMSRQILLDGGLVVTPRIALTGLWDFDRTDSVNVASGLAIGTDDFRARIESDLSIEMVNGSRLSGGVYFDGIGANAFSAYGGKASLRIPLN